MDPALVPLLNAHSESEQQERIDQLLREADTIVKEVVGYRFGVFLDRGDLRKSEDAEDVRGEVLVELIARLRRLAGDPKRADILQFPNYVAAMSHRACHDYLRKKYPQRAKLKNRIRYLLSHDTAFAIWEAGGEWLCGEAAWRGQRKGPQAAQSASGYGARGLPDLSGLLQDIFAQAAGPVELDDLVQTVAGAMGITDRPPANASGRDGELRNELEEIADPRADTAADVERRAFLTRLWEEICILPVRQRTVLLLNLRDTENHDVLPLFPLTGVVSMRGIADALELPQDEFADLWNGLPMDDDSIAKRLGATRQQVINLRKAARQRLERRMKGFL